MKKPGAKPRARGSGIAARVASTSGAATTRKGGKDVAASSSSSFAASGDTHQSTPSFANAMMKKKTIQRPIFNSTSKRNSSTSQVNSIALKPYEDLLKQDLLMKLDFINKMQTRSFQVVGRRNIASFHDVSRSTFLESDDDNEEQTLSTQNASTVDSTRNANCRDIAYLSYLLENTKINKLGIVDSELNFAELNSFLSSKYMLNSPSKGATTSMLELNLSHNNIGVKGLFVLADAFAESTSSNRLRSLRKLNLSDNRLVGVHVSRKQIKGVVDTKGVEAFFQSLPLNDVIEWLDLSCNCLGGVVNRPGDVGLLAPVQRIEESIHNNNIFVYTSSVNGNRAVSAVSGGYTGDGAFLANQGSRGVGVAKKNRLNSAGKLITSSSSSSSSSSSVIDSTHEPNFHTHSSILYDDASEEYLNSISYGLTVLRAIRAFLHTNKQNRMKVLNLNSNAFNYAGDEATKALFHDIYEAMYSGTNPTCCYASVCGIDYARALKSSSGSSESTLDLTFSDLCPYNGVLLGFELISNSNICTKGSQTQSSSAGAAGGTADNKNSKGSKKAATAMGHTRAVESFPFGRPTSARDIASVTSIDLSNNIDFGDGVSSLLDVFLRFQPNSSSNEVTYCKTLNIKKLNFSNTNMTIASVTTLGKIIENKTFPSLESLDLSRNSLIGDEGMRRIRKPICTNNHIRYLNFGSCGITKQGAGYVAEILLHITQMARADDKSSVYQVDLSRNNLERNGFEIISRGLCVDGAKSGDSAAVSGTIDIDISFNDISSRLLPDRDDPHGNAALRSERRKLLFSFFSSNSCIARFAFCGNPICGSRVDAPGYDAYDPWPILQLADHFQSPGCALSKLDFSNIDIGARSTRKLFGEVFTAKSSLKHLNICNSNISEQGAIAIGAALPNIRGLQVLLMSSCGIGPLGCQELLAGLAKNTSIRTIDLSRNQITGYSFADEREWDYDVLTAAAIKALLQANSSLTDMDVSFNRLFAYSLSDNNTTLAASAGSDGTADDATANNCNAAIRLLIEGIHSNDKMNGGLQRLNIVGNRIRPCIRKAPGQGCRLCSNPNPNPILRLEKKQILRQKTSPKNAAPSPHTAPLPQYVDSCNYCYCFVNATVTGLIVAMDRHRSLRSLLGANVDGSIDNGYLDLTCANLDEHTARILAHELKFNQTITTLNLEGNSSIGDHGLHLLLETIGSNVALRNLRLPRIVSSTSRAASNADNIFSLHTSATFNALDARLQLYKSNKSIINSGDNDICSSASVYTVKLKAFNYRMIIIYWIRSHYVLGNLPLHIVLEFVIGGGPKVRWLLDFVAKY